MSLPSKLTPSLVVLKLNVIMQKCAIQDTNLVFPFQGLLPFVRLYLAGFVLWLLTPIALAQEPASEASETVNTPANVTPADPDQEELANQPIPLEDVSNRAETTIADLDALLASDTTRQTLDRIGSESDLTLREIELNLAKTRQVLTGRPNVRALQKVEAQLGELLAHLSSLKETLDEQLDTLRVSLERVDNISAVWDATDELARAQEGIDETTMNRIAAVRSEIDKARSAIVKLRNDTSASRDKLVNPSVEIGETVDQLRGAVEARIGGIFRTDYPPLWSPLVRVSVRKEWQTLGPRHFLKRLEENMQDAFGSVETLGLQIILFAVFALGLRWLRGRSRATAGGGEHLRHAELVFEHPWSTALLLTALVTIPLHPLAPRSAGPIAAALIAMATLRIVQRFLPPAMTPLAWGLVILFILDRARDLLDTTPTLDRLVFLGEMIGALGLLLWLLRPSRLARLPTDWRNRPLVKLLETAMRVGAALLAFAILAEIAGWSDLAVLLGDGVLRSGFLGLFVFVLLKILHGLASLALVLRPLRLLRSISLHQQFVEKRLELVLSVFAVVLWAALVFGQIGLLAPAADFVGQTLNASFNVGTLSVSVSDVLVFAFTVGASFLLARLLQVILQEDVFSRVRTARGVPYAISSIARYCLIFLGFFVGLSAAGVELTKLAVVAGGLGVGIGFGLQDVVNNFVSGLIMLFERPIDVGDTIELSGTSGTMKRIGIRASVIHTFDGAEVIVPNGMLISDKVVNWTLSDRRRRIDLDVGVEYGTPAQRVIDLLVGVAKANPKVLSDPAPCAYFVNFGESSLDFKLRVWFAADSSTNTYTIHSEIAVAVQQALDEAGIGVPFPQSDLHLISVPPNAAPNLISAKPQSGLEEVP